MSRIYRHPLWKRLARVPLNLFLALFPRRIGMKIENFIFDPRKERHDADGHPINRR